MSRAKKEGKEEEIRERSIDGQAGGLIEAHFWLNWVSLTLKTKFVT